MVHMGLSGLAQELKYIKDWSLITGRGGGGGSYKTGGVGGQVLPLQKRGGKTFSRAEGRGAQKVSR